MLTYIKLVKSQLSKKIQTGFLGERLGYVKSKLGKKTQIDLAISLAKDPLPKLATKATSSVLDQFERKIRKRIYR